MRLYRDERALRPSILPTIGKGERERARGDRDGEGPKGGSWDKTRSNGRY
jgi:hypothetical protein